MGSQSLYWRNGLIAVGGRPLREIDLKWWRSQIGLVQQEPFLFNDSVYRNVEFGLVGTEWEDADLETKKDLVKQACKEAFADEFITRLPEVGDSMPKNVNDGADTLIGLLYHCRRRWYQVEWRTASTTCHCTEYCQAAQDPHSGRGDK